MTRNELLQQIKDPKQVWDIIVIGGGATGLGCAVEAASRGYRTLLIEQSDSALVWSSDTGPTRRLWEIANATANVKAVCIETTFDNALQRIAALSLHLTPQTLVRELAKLERRLPVLLHHLKPPCQEAIRREIQALANPDFAYLEQGKTYHF